MGGRAAMGLGIGLAVALGAMPATSLAAGGEAPVPAASAPAAEDSLLPELRAGGRVFTRAEASSLRDYSREWSLASARLFVDARWKGLLRATVEADFADKNVVKDAFLELKLPQGFSLRGGKFRAPFSLRETTGSWRLPLVRRGLVNDVARGLGYGGRRLGAQVGFSRKEWKKLEVELGAFTGRTADQEDLAGRVTLRPLAALELGASAWSLALGSQGTAAGLDATVHLFGFSLASEGLLLSQTTADQAPAGRALALTSLLTRRTLLTGTREAPGYWLEPVLGAEWLRQPDASQWAGGTAGLNGGQGDLWRLQLQLGRGLLEAGRPAETRVMAQAGARF